MLKPVQGSRFDLAEMLFDLGPGLLNRIEVGGVGRQLEQRCPGRFDPLPHPVHFMGREIVSLISLPFHIKTATVSSNVTVTSIVSPAA